MNYSRILYTACIVVAVSIVIVLVYLCSGSASQDTNSTPVIIDTDGGADDAMALLLFLWNEGRPPSERNDSMKLVAVTTVSGNTGIHNATRNINATMEAAGRLDIPVYAGASNGLLGKRQQDYYFGNDGFGDFLPPLQHVVLQNDAVEQLVAQSKQYEGALIIICLGPMTNIALAQRKDPLFLHRIKGIHMMGGTAMGYGNIKPGVEYNVYQDPESVDIVFRESPKVITVMPYDPVFLNQIPIGWRDNVLGKLNSTRMNFLNKAERKALMTLPFWSSVDPQAVATAIWPQLVTKNLTALTVVETSGVYARGAFLVQHNLLGVTSEDSNVNLIQEVDLKYYQDLLLMAFRD